MVTVPTTTPLVMQASGIHKSFLRGKQRSHVLQGVDLEIRQGECVFLVGPSGSGKSTLLAILGCILSPDAGDVRLLGQNVEHLSSQERTLLRRDKIGFVFQRFHLVRGLSALENVTVPLLLRGAGERRSGERGRELLAEVGLEGFIHADPRRMSSGQCQRIAIARALAADPDLVFADEPTASLDEASGEQAMALLARLAKEKGKTAIVVTHDPRIYRFADRILQMQEGKLVPLEARTMETSARPLPRSMAEA
jgi:putative ABC transport system ATP-binding protein